MQYHFPIGIRRALLDNAPWGARQIAHRAAWTTTPSAPCGGTSLKGGVRWQHPRTCANGNEVFSGTQRFEAVGLATYLGQVEAVIVNERCTSDSPGILTFYGTWTYTGAQADVLQGTHKTVVGVGETLARLRKVSKAVARLTSLENPGAAAEDQDDPPLHP